MKHLTDDQLEQSADQARARELKSLHEMLLHLKEIDRRRLFSKRNFPSIYDYAMERFKYSYDEVHRRVCAMKLLKDMPEIESKIADGSLQLTHLTQARSFFQKVEHSKVEKLEILRKLENTTKAETKKILYNEELKARYSFEADQTFEAIVERLKGLHPHLSFDNLMRRVCEIALAKVDPLAKAERIKAKNERAHRESRASAKVGEPINSIAKSVDQNRASAKLPIRYVTAKAKQQVWLASDGKCQRCRSTFALEIDHIEPFAKGGSNEAANLRLLCRKCNQLKAIEVYGETKMEQYLLGEKTVAYAGSWIH